MAKCKVFASFAFSRGYRQLPLHKDSDKCQSLITPNGILSPTRVSDGASNALRYLQDAMRQMMSKKIGNNMLI